MPRARLEESHYLTSSQAAQALGLTTGQLRRRLDRGLLPPPTVTRGDHLRLFSREWVARAKTALRALTPLSVRTKGGENATQTGSQ